MKIPEYDSPQDDPYYVMLGRCLLGRRIAKKMTQEEVALEGGLSRAEVQFLENAKRRPNMGSIRRYCGGLDIGLTELSAELDWRLAHEAGA